MLQNYLSSCIKLCFWQKLIRLLPCHLWSRKCVEGREQEVEALKAEFFVSVKDSFFSGNSILINKKISQWNMGTNFALFIACGYAIVGSWHLCKSTPFVWSWTKFGWNIHYLKHIYFQHSKMLLVTPNNTKYYAEEISTCLLHRVNLDNVIIWKSILHNSEKQIEKGASRVHLMLNSMKLWD